MGRAVIGALACLLLAACDSTSTAATTPAASSPPAAAAALADTAGNLCDTYCTELYTWPSSCPPGSTNMTLCSGPMARAADILHDVDRQLTAADPGIADTAPDLQHGVEQALGFWASWSQAPPGQHDCLIVFDVNSELFDPPTVGRCTSAAASMGTFLPYIAAQLQTVGGA